MRRLLSILSGVLLFAALVPAQESRSTIMGHVKDPQGAMIAKAVVVVTNLDTNAPVKLETNEAGYYEAPLLIPGPYSVTAEMQGFKKAVQTGITLQLADRRNVEIVLQVGAVSETVSVTAEAPLIDVSRTDSGRTIDERSVQDLPAMANTVFSMVRFTAGVQSGGPLGLGGPHSTQGGSDYNTGTGLGGNTWTIDGAVNDGNARYTANLPSVDAVAETKVLTTTFDGSFGHSLGLGIAVQTKSGTNSLHGTASDNYWNQRWQGASFFAKQNYYSNIASLRAKGDNAGADAAAAKAIQPAGHSNLWTLNVTGPVWIPKIFNGRDKVFFTFSYNGEKDMKPEDTSTYNRIVPTAANKKGDFSDLLGIASNPGNYQLYDPYSTRPDPARPGHYIRTAIPGNVLPGNYTALGKKWYDNYSKYWPDPNNWFDKTKAPDSNDYLSVSSPFNWNFNQFSGRLDMNIGSKFRAFGRYSQNHFTEWRGDWTSEVVQGLSGNNAATGGNGGNTGVWRDDQNGVLDLIYTITPRTIGHFSFSVSNWMSAPTQGAYSYKYKPSDVGLPSYLDSYCGSWCYLPQFGVSGYSTLGITGTPNPSYNRFFMWNGDLYHNRSNHSFRAGLDIRSQIHASHSGNNDGTYQFGNDYFRKFDDNGGVGYSPANIGLAWASFMMGMPTTYNISANDSYIVQNPYYSWFVQDTWRVTDKLTLTLSLRNEIELGAKERWNRFIIDYDKNARLPISDAVEAAYAKNAQPELAASLFKITGGAVYAGASGARERAWDTATMFLPRVGVGYQLDKKTVIRGGWGVYYDTQNVNATNWGPNQNYFSRSTYPTMYNKDANSIPVFTPAFSADGSFPASSPLNNPFPVRADGTRYDAPLRDQLGYMATVGSDWTYPNYNYHARQQRWRASVERQISSHDVVEASYEGTWNSNLTYNVPSNLGVPSTYYNFTQTRNDTNNNWLNANLPNPYYGITTSGAVPSNANAIYPDSVKNNAMLWTWMSTNTLFTGSTRSRANLLFKTPNGNVMTPEPRFHTRTSTIAISYNHRFFHGLSANFGYTKLITANGNGYLQGWNPDDPTMPQAPHWNHSGAPNRITATWVYDLPFGRGRAFVHNRIAGAVVGGWTLSGTYQFEQGNRLTFGNIYFYGDPNSIAIDNPTIGHYFNTAGCVSSAASAAAGDTVVSSGTCTANGGFEKRSANAAGSYQYRTFPDYVEMRAPGQSEYDASLTRDFKIHERFSFQTRLDMLNVMNHSFLSGPNTTPTSSQFGMITAQNQSPNRFIQIQGRLRW